MIGAGARPGAAWRIPRLEASTADAALNALPPNVPILEADTGSLIVGAQAAALRRADAVRVAAVGCSGIAGHGRWPGAVVR